MLGSDTSRIAVWNTIWETIWKIRSESTQSKHLHWWAQRTLGFLPALTRRPGARILSCKWVRQFSLSRDITGINKLKTGHVELSGKVCVQCALAQPQASHPASNHFQRLTESSNSSYLPFLISTSSQRMTRTKMTTLYPRFASTRKGEKFRLLIWRSLWLMLKLASGSHVCIVFLVEFVYIQLTK